MIPSRVLSERQRQCVERLARGWPEKRIAADLGLGYGTVRVHIAAARLKLGERKASGLVIEALRRGEITINDREFV